MQFLRVRSQGIAYLVTSEAVIQLSAGAESSFEAGLGKVCPKHCAHWHNSVLSSCLTKGFHFPLAGGRKLLFPQKAAWENVWPTAWVH